MPSTSDHPTSRPTSSDAIVGEVVPRRRQRDIDGRKVVTRLIGVIARTPRYVKLGWLLMNDPTVSTRGKAALGGGLAYALSPVDPIPGFIPVLGQLDDLAALILAVRVALRSAPAEVAEGHLRAAGLSWDIIERDIVTIRATTVWITRRGSALAVRLVRSALGGAMRQLRSLIPARECDKLIEAP